MTDHDIAEAVKRHGGQKPAARALGISHGKVQRALRRLQAEEIGAKALVEHTVADGIVMIGSDGHYWPKVAVPMHDRFVERCSKLSFQGQLAGVIYNGDAFDGARVSRHARIGWENRPQVHEELKEVETRLGAIEAAAQHGAFLDWPLGNHDARFETFLSGKVPEYERIVGVHLKDHFPVWTPCWGVRINNSVVVKHRMKGGVHARWNNTKDAGVTVVTAHSHRLGVTPVTDYAGTRWGCECGMLGNPRGPMFQAYTEAGPVNWQPGWLELRFVRGVLQWPQAVVA